MAPSPEPEDQKGPFTHTWTGGLSVGGYKRVGRWPGVVTLWDRFLEALGHRLRPRWEWFLYGWRVWTRATFPSATVSGWETNVDADGNVTTGIEFAAGLGRLFETITGSTGEGGGQ